MNYTYTARRQDLSRMYHDLKNGKTVKVAGMTVEAISPAFKVDVSEFLPINFLDGDNLGQPSAVPGSVVRNYQDALLIIQ
mmetsp:Transcript_4235/g.8616  ORF Transcript_4235/g.8616 Transcript_4235/m.8616 type:complete len:80 (+) Transcript_4235:551-790(+)